MKVMYICVENLHSTGILQSMVLEPALKIRDRYDIDVYFTSMERESEINNIDHVENCIIGRRAEDGLSVYNIYLHVLFLVRLLFETKSMNVLHCRSYMATLTGLICKIFWKNKVIFDVRGYLIDESVESGRLRVDGLKYKVLRILENILFKYADEIISVSDAMRRDIKNKFGRESAVVRNPSSVVSGRYFADSNKRVLIYNGSLKKWHMPHLFFEVVEYGLRKSIFDEVKIITSDTRIALEFLKKHSLENCVSISLHTCSSSEVKQHLIVGSLGWCVIDPTYSKRFCWPVKFNEYLGAGMGVVVNKYIGDLAPIVEENNLGVIVDNDFSVESIIEKLRLFWLNETPLNIPESLEKNLSWDHQITSIFELYNK